MDRQSQITAALCSAVEEGSSGPACDQLMALVYDDLRRIAASFLRYEKKGHSLSPTDLVHEAYTKLIDQTRVDWQGKAHFRAVAGQAMRRILVDHARRQARVRHGGAWQRVTFDPAVVGKGDEGLSAEEMLALDDALTRLAKIDAREAQVVELRFFVGFSNEEIAEFLGLSSRSVIRDWLHARAWLHRELTKPVAP